MLRGNRRSATRSDRKRNTGRNSSTDPNPCGPPTCGLALYKLEHRSARPAVRERPPKPALVCTSGPFGEDALGNSPRRKAGRPPRGREGVRRVDPPARRGPGLPDQPAAAAAAESGSSPTAWS